MTRAATLGLFAGPLALWLLCRHDLSRLTRTTRSLERDVRSSEVELQTTQQSLDESRARLEAYKAGAR